MLAMMADNIEHVISYWMIFQKFESPALGGFAVFAHWVPFLLFSVYAGALADRFDRLDAFLGDYFGSRGFTDTAYDRLGGVASGFLSSSLANRAPYVSPTEEDVKALQDWYREHFPEMLQL